MATNFPASLDNGTSLPYPSSSNLTNSPSLASGQDNQNDSLIAIQNKLGITASTPTTSNLLIGTGAGTSTWSKIAPAGVIVGTTDAQTLTNKTLPGAVVTGGVFQNALLSADSISGFATANSGSIYGVPITLGVIQTAGTVSGASLTAGSIGTTALTTNAVQANQLATNAITLGYSQIVASGTANSSSFVNLSNNLTLTFTVPSGGRRIKITFFSSGVLINVAGAAFCLGFNLDGTIVQQATRQETTSGYQFPANMVYSSTSLTAGSHTVTLQANSNSAGTITVGAGAAGSGFATPGPAFILVEAI